MSSGTISTEPGTTTVAELLPDLMAALDAEASQVAGAPSRLGAAAEME